MASKEASQRQIIEKQFVQIADLQKTINRLKEEVCRWELNLKENDGPTSSPGKREQGESATRPHSIESVNGASTEGEEQQMGISADLQEHEAVQGAVSAIKDDSQRAREQVEADLLAEIANLKRHLADAIADKDRETAEAIASLQQEQEQVAGEMESSLAASEEQRRQLKMKADQAMFELSRVRDEHQLQRNNDFRQMTELRQAYALSEKSKDDLEVNNSDLVRRVQEMEGRFSRKPSPQPLPPQMPPPTTPLPPLPLSPSLSSSSHVPSMVKSPSTTSSMLATPGVGQNLKRRSHESLTEITQILTAIPGQASEMVQKVVAERDWAMEQKQSLKAPMASSEERLKEWVSYQAIHLVRRSAEVVGNASGRGATTSRQPYRRTCGCQETE